MSPKVSVVVPVYNAEKYLRQCVESLLMQTLKDTELIFVDDGSTDGSVAILKEFMEKDSRIHIYCQTNQYAAVARNNGMSHATGKYIIFLDSDDFFAPSMLEECYEAAEEYNAEIVAFDFWHYDDTSGQFVEDKRLSPIFPKGIITREKREKFIYKLWGAPWNKMILLDFVHRQHLQYQVIRSTDDEYFNRMAVILAERIVYLKKPFVYYRENVSSSLQGQREKDLTCGVQCAMALRKEIKERAITDPVANKLCADFTESIVKLIFNTEFGVDSVRRGYLFTKEHLVPDLYDSADAMLMGSIVRRIYDSRSFEEFLWLDRNAAVEELGILKNTHVSKNSTSYRLGKALLFIPSKFLSILKSK